VSGSLLEGVRGLLERTYRIRSGLGPIAPFVIGDRGLRAIYGLRSAALDVGSGTLSGPKMLVREKNDRVSACVYFPDAMIRRLERFPPQRGLREENFDAFAAFVEEIDHLLVLAEHSIGRRPVRLFELELHADVSKYLVLARFLAGATGRRLPEHRIWLRRRLFEGVRSCEDDPAARERYRDAARSAVRLLDGLDRLDPARRLSVLRRFHDASVSVKLRLIATIAA